MIKHVFGSLVICLTMVVMGCRSESAEDRIAVRGNVTLDGRPLEKALIRFMPKQDGVAAVALVTNGAFELDDPNGLAPGEHAVIVTPDEPELEEAVELIGKGSRDPLGSRTVPSRYQNRGALHANVVSGSINFFQFDLRSR